MNFRQLGGKIKMNAKGGRRIIIYCLTCITRHFAYFEYFKYYFQYCYFTSPLKPNDININNNIHNIISILTSMPLVQLFIRRGRWRRGGREERRKREEEGRGVGVEDSMTRFLYHFHFDVWHYLFDDWNTNRERDHVILPSP